MKSILKYGALSLFLITIACKKDLNHFSLGQPESPVLSSSLDTAANKFINIANADSNRVLLTLNWTDPNWMPVTKDGAVIINYIIDADTSNLFLKPTELPLVGLRQKNYTGQDLNSLVLGLGGTPGTLNDIHFRVKAFVGSDTIVSQPYLIKINPYKSAYPALLVRGANAWTTPVNRTNGYILNSVKNDGRYEGYVNFPNADGWGGDALKLQSTTDGTVYGWGTDAHTMSVNGGNFWFAPAPAYMKVNADVTALTVSYTPVNFFISGDQNGWSTSATPMTYQVATKTWEANGVTFAAGNTFVFTSNGNYDISYKVGTDGKLFFAGPPAWAGNAIKVAASGTYKIVLDLGGGDGNYTYSIQ